jgi:hypothetical protein
VLGDNFRGDFETALGFGIHARALFSLGAIQGVQMLALIAAEFGVVAPLRYVPIGPARVPIVAFTTRR